MHTPPPSLLLSLRRTMIQAVVPLITMIAAILCSPAESLVPAWRGDSDATWYQWADPHGPETLISSDPDWYSSAAGGSIVPAPAPSGAARLVTTIAHVPEPTAAAMAAAAALAAAGFAGRRSLRRRPSAALPTAAAAETLEDSPSSSSSSSSQSSPCSSVSSCPPSSQPAKAPDAARARRPV